MIGKLIRLFVLILLAPVIYAFTYEAFLFVFQSSITFESIQWFLLGFALYLLIYVLFLRGRIVFWEIFEHELAHLLTGLLFLRRPAAFVVAPGEVNGVVGLEPRGCGDTPISLAPYFLPTLTLPLLLIKPFLPAPFDQIVNFLIGFTLAFHYASLFAWEFRLRQPDFRTTGIIFSIVITIFLNIIFLVIILGVVSGNYASILDYFRDSFDRTVETYKAAIEILRTRVIPAIQGFLQRND